MLLEVRNVSKEYKRDGKSFLAVDNVSFWADSGEFIGIKGHSGSGKSTLLSLIAGLLVPTSGEILFDGENIGRLSDNEVSQLRSTKIGYIPQGQSLLQSLTVWDNIRLPFYLAQRQERIKKNPEDKAAELLKRFGIEHLADSLPGSLSGGELRRGAIARAVSGSPKILIADEPTSDLDSDNTAEIISFFREIAKAGTAVIMVTHELDTIKNADRIFTMTNGVLTV